jgi:hypothetical protein
MDRHRETAVSGFVQYERPREAITVACVWVRGPVPYTLDYVVRLERMVRRHIDRPYRFVCLTDRPELMPAGIDGIRISADGRVPDNGRGYWAKVQLFDPRHQWTTRMLFLDLDVLVVSSLAPIIDAPSAFALTEDALTLERAHLDRDRYGRRIVRRFNSSVIVWDGGLCRDLFEQWTPDVAQTYSTDQDWIGERYPGAMALPYEWFPRISRVQPPWPIEAKVVLVKKPKNHEACARWPWFEPLWGAA